MKHIKFIQFIEESPRRFLFLNIAFWFAIPFVDFMYPVEKMLLLTLSFIMSIWILESKSWEKIPGKVFYRIGFAIFFIFALMFNLFFSFLGDTLLDRHFQVRSITLYYATCHTFFKKSEVQVKYIGLRGIGVEEKLICKHCRSGGLEEIIGKVEFRQDCNY